MKKSTGKTDKATIRLTQKVSPAVRDELWKASLKHERQLMKQWNWKWDFLLQPEFQQSFRVESIDKQLEEHEKSLDRVKNIQLEKRVYNINKSPPVPTKSSEFIGWRSSDFQNSLNLFPTKPLRPKKICFRDEQYGVYRIQKYLREELGDSKSKDETPREIVLPSKHIVHKVKPLIC